MFAFSLFPERTRARTLFELSLDAIAAAAAAAAVAQTLVVYAHTLARMLCCWYSSWVRLSAAEVSSSFELPLAEVAAVIFLIFVFVTPILDDATRIRPSEIGSIFQPTVGCSV
jgi:hypothetical protein